MFEMSVCHCSRRIPGESSRAPSSVSDIPKVRRRTGATMPLELQMRLPQTPLTGSSPSALSDMFDMRFPIQTHDTTSIYMAAQKQQRMHKEQAQRRSSTNVPPAKSCLAISPKSEPTSPTKVKRKVSFADDKGLSLTEVRVMRNEINELPRWTQEFIFQHFPARLESTVVQSWDPLFPQPASDYLAFRKQIENRFVALENVIVKKDDDLLTGTIKVKNITFEKHVFVRATFDCWASYCDYPGIFVSQGASTLPAMFDTFSFSIKVPASTQRYGLIELCIGYKTPRAEYWDNNGGKNYKLASVSRRTSEVTTSPVMTTRTLIQPKFASAFSNGNVADWTDFTSWNQILSQGPYW